METICMENLTFSYDSKIVLDHFSLELPLEGLTALTGPSGCGKTTLLRILAGLEKPKEGRIALIGRAGGSVNHPHGKGRTPVPPVPLQVSILFQEDRLLPWRTAGEHLSDIRPGQTDEWLAFCELEEERDAFPRELSGGQARRLALARCCALGGELLLLDEPFAGVDTERRARILGRLKKTDTPMLLATHEPDVVTACNHAVYLDGPPLRLEDQTV